MESSALFVILLVCVPCLISAETCPFVNGTAALIQSSVAWNVIDLLLTPNTRVQGPNQQAIFRLQPLFQSLNQTSNCLVCYSYPSENMRVITRLMCEDGSDAVLLSEEQKKDHMHVIMTKVDLPTGFSKDYDCNINLYQHVVLDSNAVSTLQCWLRPLS